MKSTFYILTLVLAFALVQFSCSSESDMILGCTDPGSTSYDPEATTDDGSCTYPRDKFLGLYTGQLDCNKDYFDDDTFQIKIVEDPENNSGILINFICCPRLQNFKGTVSGEKLTVNSTIKVENIIYLKIPCGTSLPGSTYTGTAKLTASFILMGTTLNVNSWQEEYRDTNNDVRCSVSCQATFEKS